MIPLPSLTAGGRIAISIVGQLTFIGSLIAAFVLKNENMMTMCVGAAIANATTIVSWWLGSSSGSEKKDDIIANSMPTTPATNGKALNV